MDVLLFGTIGSACILLGAVSAVDAADRIRDHDPVAILSVCSSLILATGALGSVAAVLALLEPVR